jgi:hypothetical protein
MRHKLITYLIFTLFAPKLFGQPGWAYKVQGNLNFIDSIQLKRCLADGNLCYFGDIEIDSTTDLSRLDQISFLEEVTLVIKLSSIPTEFKNVKFPNLKKLNIHCGKNLTDLSNLQYFSSLEKLYLSNVNGKKEVDINFSKLINLKSIEIILAPEIVRMDKIFQAPKLESIRLVSFPSLKFLTIDTLNSNTKIKNIVLADCPKFDIKNIETFINLEILSLNDCDFSSIPVFFSTSLTFLSISNNQTLIDIKNINQYKNLSQFYLKDNPLIKDFSWKKE